ncbi:ABC transporter substrate-binding protein [Microvirga sp. TS319]|uniref:ABC transporter substrate-binding protein n=1 Tax=Microvirga sp. TS319 TaxID=3241165 RepID=UPI00351A8320
MRTLLLLIGLVLAVPALAQDKVLSVAIVMRAKPPSQPVSRLDDVVTDEGAAGARLGIADNQTTGRFTGQRFVLVEKRLDRGDDPALAIQALADEGIRFVIAATDGATLGTLSRAAATRNILLLNAGAPDDSLRNEACSRDTLHTLPSRAMIADGLAQYFAFKRWKRWFLVTGRQPGDKELAEAYRLAARKFGMEIVAEKEWTFQPGNGRTDTGHVQLQTEIPAFTQGPDYDVLVVADEADEFGDYLEGRTARPRPVAGTHGLVATGWSPVTEQWGATQLQNRFEKQANRRMTAIDYAAWAAARAIGEAAFRSRSSDPGTIEAYMRSQDFLLSGFKGQGQGFREWDGQMRQPILIVNQRLLVSASPQPGFLHKGSELDSLGTDKDESRCKL